MRGGSSITAGHSSWGTMAGIGELYITVMEGQSVVCALPCPLEDSLGKDGDGHGDGHGNEGYKPWSR